MFNNISLLDTHSQIIYSENPYTLFIDNENYHFSNIKIDDHKCLNNRVLVKTSNNNTTIKTFENYIFSETFLNGNIYISNTTPTHITLTVDPDEDCDSQCDGKKLIKYNILSPLTNPLTIINGDDTTVYYKDKQVSDKITVKGKNITINDNQVSFSKYGETYHITDSDNNNIIVVTALIKSLSDAPTLFLADTSNGGFTNITIKQTKNVKLEQIFFTSEAIYADDITPYYDLSSLKIPHWEYDGEFLMYYGSLAKCSGDINITLSPDLILPFGLSNAIFKVKVSDIYDVTSDHWQDLKNKLNDLNNNGGCMRINYSDFSNYKHLIKHWKLSGDRVAIENSLADYINTQTRNNGKKLNSFTISGGGILSGKGIRMKPFFKEGGDPNWMHVAQWDNLGAKRANFINSIWDSWNQLNLGDFLNSVEHWILGGLLEVWANTIDIENISIVQGFCRGRAPTQLNGKNIYPDIYPRLQMVQDLLNTKVTIKNTQIVLHDVGQMDGYDSFSSNIMENIYFNCEDDNLKLNSDISASDITFMCGDSGGAICYGGYNNNIPIENTTITNIYIHGYGNSGKTYDQICNDGQGGEWPGPAILYAPWVPMINKKGDKVNSIKKVTLKNIYLPVGGWNDNYPLFTGGYLMNTFSCMALNPIACKDNCNYRIDNNPDPSTWNIINLDKQISLNSSVFINNCVHNNNLTIQTNLMNKDTKKQYIQNCRPYRDFGNYDDSPVPDCAINSSIQL